MTGTVLVTGATGTVGSDVVAGLEDSDVTVRAATRDPDAARDRLAADEYVAFDFERPETYYPALDGVDALFLVRPPAISRVERVVNPFVDAAARMGVGHVAVLSVLGAEKNPLLPHRRIERHVAGADLSATFLRASFFMQNFLTTHREGIVERDEISVPAGDGATSFVDARDVGAVAAEDLAAAVEGSAAAGTTRAYDLTGPGALDYHEAAGVFSEVLDRPITYRNPSAAGFAWREWRRGRPAGMVAVMLVLYTTARLGLAARVTDDVRSVLGRPPTDLRTFVADHADRFRR